MTCRQSFNARPCGGEMRLGKAFYNDGVICFDDFGGDAGERGSTCCADHSKASLVDVFKCVKCGHSVLANKESAPTKDGASE